MYCCYFCSHYYDSILKFINNNQGNASFYFILCVRRSSRTCSMDFRSSNVFGKFLVMFTRNRAGDFPKITSKDNTSTKDSLS